MLNRPVKTQLPFRKLHKNWGGGLWFRYFIAGVIVVVAIALICVLVASIYNIFPVNDDNEQNVLSEIINGAVGGSIVYVVLWFGRRVHNVAHYGQELSDYINDSQKRYKITREEAAELLSFDDDALLTIDNFFRYIDHKDQDQYLPRIQQFGTQILPYEKGYLRITLYWQREKGFFLVEEYSSRIEKLA